VVVAASRPGAINQSVNQAAIIRWGGRWEHAVVGGRNAKMILQHMVVAFQLESHSPCRRVPLYYMNGCSAYPNLFEKPNQTGTTVPHTHVSSHVKETLMARHARRCSGARAPTMCSQMWFYIFLLAFGTSSLHCGGSSKTSKTGNRSNYLL
jgi:hypothetical protein